MSEQCKCESCACSVQEVRESVHPKMCPAYAEQYHFGLRAYKWETSSFGITLNFNKNHTIKGNGIKPNITLDIWRFTFVLGWDQYNGTEGSTLS